MSAPTCPDCPDCLTSQNRPAISLPWWRLTHPDERWCRICKARFTPLPVAATEPVDLGQADASIAGVE